MDMGIERLESKKPFRERCLQFGVAVVRLIQRLPEGRGSTVQLRQLEKSATSIGANVAESQSAQSRADFISKFEIALKEARETDYWLRMLKETETKLEGELGPLIGECWQIAAILVTSVKTAKRNGEESRRQNGRAESRDQN